MVVSIVCFFRDLKKFDLIRRRLIRFSVLKINLKQQFNRWLNMTQWNSNKIIADLQRLPNVLKVENSGQGGDVDSDNLVLFIKDTKEHLFVAGFATNWYITSPSDCEVQFVEVTDGQQSDTGLTSSNATLGHLYIDVRNYFQHNGFQVVESNGPYF